MNTLQNYLGDNGTKEEEEKRRSAETLKELQEKIKKQKFQDVNFNGFDGKLGILIDGIRKIPNYNNIKSYIREKILPDNPGISYKKLSIKAGIHEGVALVILYDLYNDKQEADIEEIEDKYYNNFHYEE